MLAGPLPGICVAAEAFGSVMGGYALGWDSGQLLGAHLLPLAPLKVHTGLSHVGLYWTPLAPLPLVRASHTQTVWSSPLRAHTILSWSPLAPLAHAICLRSLLLPPPLACAASLPLLGWCVAICASWRNDWQAAQCHEGLQSCTASPEFRAPKVPWDYQLLAKCAWTTSSSYGVPVSLRLAESTCFSFVSGALVAGTCPQVLLFRFSNIQHPMHHVSALWVQISRAGF